MSSFSELDSQVERILNMTDKELFDEVGLSDSEFKEEAERVRGLFMKVHERLTAVERRRVTMKNATYQGYNEARTLATASFSGCRGQHSFLWCSLKGRECMRDDPPSSFTVCERMELERFDCYCKHTVIGGWW